MLERLQSHRRTLVCMCVCMYVCMYDYIAVCDSYQVASRTSAAQMSVPVVGGVNVLVDTAM